MATQSFKLGFARKIISEGTPPESEEIINADGTWERKVSDLRDDLKLLDIGVNPRERVATFISYDEGGLFITLVTPVEGREEDHVSGWIYIPRILNVPVEKIMAAHQLVKDSLQYKVSDEELKRFFNGDYQPREIAEVYKASEKGIQKWGYYDLNKSGYSLTEFFERAYQEVFTHYEAIYLHEKDTIIGIRDGKRFEDLTQTKLRKSVLICPPAEAESQRWTKVNAQIFLNGKPFIKKARMKEGVLLRMELRRDGFETICAEEQKLTLEHDGKPFVFPKKNLKWMRRISTNDFDVRNCNGVQLNNRAIIRIDTHTITREGILLSEDIWNKCNATIKCTNYQTIENKEFKLSMGENKVKMYREPINYNVTMVNGEKAKMTLESEHLPEDGSSPLKGYELGSRNHLRFKSDVWKQRLIGFVVAIALYLVVAACMALYAWFTTREFSLKSNCPFVEVTEVKKNTTKTSIVSFDEGQNECSTAAIDYLDKKEIWHRDTLEGFEETKGLFDALNTYDYQKLTELNTKLAVSCNYKNLMDTVIICKEFMNMKKGSKYLSSEDSTITWRKYAEKLSQGKDDLDNKAARRIEDDNVSNSKQKSSVNQSAKTQPSSSNKNSKLKPEDSKKGAESTKKKDDSKKTPSANTQTSPKNKSSETVDDIKSKE